MLKRILSTGGMLTGLLCYTQMVFAEPGKADIAITDMTVNSDCNIVLSLKNVGSTTLPLSADDPGHGTGIQLYKGTSPHGGYRVWPNPRQPGSTTTSTSPIKINGTETITAEFNSFGAYVDTNPADNKITKTLTCTPPVVPMPDIAITSVEFTQDCLPLVRLANVGNAPQPEYQLKFIGIQRVVDKLPTGIIPLFTFTGYTGLIQPQGGAVLIDGKEYLPQNSIGYSVVALTSASFADADYKNNSKTVNIPDRCKTVAVNYSGKADIAITDMTVNSDCNIVLSLKNVGSTTLPLSADDPGHGTGIQFYKGTSPHGGYHVSPNPRQPGSTTTSTSPIKINGTETITAEFNSFGAYVDTNPADNKITKTLTCTPPVVPKADIAITSVEFTQDCRPLVRLANVGNAPLPDYQLKNIGIQRVVDNLPTGIIHLVTIVGYTNLIQPQGSVPLIDGKEYLPQNSIGYSVFATQSTFADADYNNNKKTVKLPDRCKAGSPLFPRSVSPVPTSKVIPKQPILRTLK